MTRIGWTARPTVRRSAAAAACLRPDPKARHLLLQDRLRWLADQLFRDGRTAPRRVDEGFLRLAEVAAVVSRPVRTPIRGSRASSPYRRRCEPAGRTSTASPSDHRWTSRRVRTTCSRRPRVLGRWRRDRLAGRSTHQASRVARLELLGAAQPMRPRSQFRIRTRVWVCVSTAAPPSSAGRQGRVGGGASRQSGATRRVRLAAGRPDADVQAQGESGEKAEQSDSESESHAHENFHSRHLPRRMLWCLHTPSERAAGIVVSCFQN
jgi:hypothetical protein